MFTCSLYTRGSAKAAGGPAGAAQGGGAGGQGGGAGGLGRSGGEGGGGGSPGRLGRRRGREDVSSSVAVGLPTWEDVFPFLASTDQGVIR